MIYLVSSFHRSGSSMMMRALAAGGMDASWDSEQDALNALWGRDGYQPNPAGFFATRVDAFSWPDFVVEFDGKTVKCPYQLLRNLPQHAYKLIFMLRTPEEIRASMATATPGATWRTNEAITYVYPQVGGALQTELAARGDMDVLPVWYGNAITDPLATFETIAAAGWPIDPAQAMTVVDPSQHRERVQ